MISRSGIVTVLYCLTFVLQARAIPENIKTSLQFRNGGATRDTALQPQEQEFISLKYPNTEAPGNLYLRTHARTSFDGVSVVAAVNVVINIMRPDPTISIQMRIPRLMWEMTILILAKTASTTTLPAVYLLLALILGSTAIVDLFVWAPLFASFANFETCEGGFFQPRTCRSDYTKGVGRMFVVFQCLVTGLFYLMSAITAMGSFTSIREDQKVQRHVRAMQRWDELQRSTGSITTFTRNLS